MIQQLRRLTVGWRVFGGFLVLAVGLGLAIFSTIKIQQRLLDRVEQITNVTGRADRLILLASVHVQSSRVNLMRYVGDYTPTANEALRDVEQTVQTLQSAQDLLTNPNHRTIVAQVLAKMDEYKGLVGEVQTAYSGGQPTSELLFRASQLSSGVGEQLNQIVQESEAAVAAENQSVYDDVQSQITGILAGYVIGLAVAGLITIGLGRSITRPVTELRKGAEAFLEGNLNVTVPVKGKDELSLLAQTFNQMIGGLQASQAKQQQWTAELEERVNQRTAELGQALEQLQQEAVARERLVGILRETSAPVIPIMQDIMVMPIVGTLDSERVQRVKDDLLTSIERERTEIVLLDITGLAVMDTAVANALLQTAGAAKLLGAEAILVGIAPEVAETLVHLGVDLRALRTAATLEQGLNLALRLRRRVGVGRQVGVLS